LGTADQVLRSPSRTHGAFVPVALFEADCIAMERQREVETVPAVDQLGAPDRIDPKRKRAATQPDEAIVEIDRDRGAPSFVAARVSLPYRPC